MLDEGKVITHLITCLFTVSGTPAHQRTCLEVKEHDQLKKRIRPTRKEAGKTNERGFKDSKYFCKTKRNPPTPRPMQPVRFWDKKFFQWQWNSTFQTPLVTNDHLQENPMSCSQLWRKNVSYHDGDYNQRGCSIIIITRIIVIRRGVQLCDKIVVILDLP